MFVKYSESNGLSSVSKIFCFNSLARYSGNDSCIAVASCIIPSMNTGASTSSPDFMYWWITSISSCALPTAGIGIRTFPPSLRTELTEAINADSTSCLVGWMSSFAPYVLSIRSVSTRG